jgi:hypothetical protein
MERTIRIAICCCACAAGLVMAADPVAGPAVNLAAAKKDSIDAAAGSAAALSGAAAPSGAAYRIDKPGTITFTVGVKIKGKVEKPQVMIFLPKEKPYYNKATFAYSFMDDIMKPLPFTGIEK